jgi:membrane protease YdiL (CAAX protease family)
MNLISHYPSGAKLINPWVSLVLAFFLLVFALALSGMLLSLLGGLPHRPTIMECPEEITPAQLMLMRLRLGLSILLSFGLAAWVWARIQGSPASLLSLRHQGRPWQYLLGCLLMVSVLPLLQPLAFDADSFHLPEALQGLEQWAEAEEAYVRAMLSLLVGNGSLGIFIINVLALALAPALAEELFFRGLVFRTLNRRLPLHGAVWVSAAIFSLVHFQFLGFFPRVVLGALLAYAYAWSGSLWVPVALHFFNNFLAILASTLQVTQNPDLPPGPEHVSGFTVAISLVLTLGILYTFYRKSIPQPHLSTYE